MRWNRGWEFKTPALCLDTSHAKAGAGVWSWTAKQQAHRSEWMRPSKWCCGGENGHEESVSVSVSWTVHAISNRIGWWPIERPRRPSESKRYIQKVQYMHLKVQTAGGVEDALHVHLHVTWKSPCPVLLHRSWHAVDLQYIETPSRRLRLSRGCPSNVPTCSSIDKNVRRASSATSSHSPGSYAVASAIPIEHPPPAHCRRATSEPLSTCIAQPCPPLSPIGPSDFISLQL